PLKQGGLSWFAAVLVVSAPALPLPPAHEDLGPSPWTSGTSALQGGSKKILLSSLNHLVPVPAGVSPSVERSGEAPSRRARGLFPEAPGDQQGLLVAEPAAYGAPKSQPVSHVAAPGDGEEILVPGSPESAATSPLQASPQPQSQPVSRHLFNPKVWTPSASGPSNFRPGNAPLLTLAPRAPEKAVSSAPQGPLAFASISHMLAATELLPPVATVRSVLDTASAALTVVSGSPRNGLESSLGLGPSVSPLLSTVPSSQLSSALPPPSYPLTSPSPTLASLSPIVGPGSPFTARARTSQDTSASVLPHTTAGRLVNVSSFPPAQPPPAVTGMAALQWTVQPRPLVPASPASLATLSLRCALGLPAGCPRVPGAVASPQSPSLSHPRQTVSLQDSRSSSPRPSRVTHFVTFRITNEALVVALGNPSSPEYQLLRDNIRHQLQSLYHEAFSSFEGIGVLQFRPNSAAVNASLVFGGHIPGPSAREVLWTLHHSVKAAGQMLGNLSLDESSLASDGSNLTDLALETLSVHLTAMEPFHPLLLLPGSAPFVLLEKKILPQVTAVVAEFYSAHPQEGPLLLFSNADQWVGVYIEYKFQTPIGTHLPGLANFLAQNIMDPAVQKSSIMANGEKAELVLCEVWLQILDQHFTEALKDKTSPDSRKLRGQLTRWLTTILRPLRPFSQVVVEKFQPDPLTARVATTFFRPAPARAIVQDCVLRGLRALRETEGLSVKMVIPGLGHGDPRARWMRRRVGSAMLGYLVIPGSRFLSFPPPPGAPSCCCSSSETKFQTSPPAPTCSQPSRVSAQP
uniref:SEA domain-containing protein n=1 Tax=Bos indicus x Bos taurus TaxID=30522 RepID=A0A4W2FI65_BOBOX